MFKKDDYIVVLDKSIKTHCAEINFIFKQRDDDRAMYPYVDIVGSVRNGNSSLTFNKEEALVDWRYGTQQEIDEYEIFGKPFDVTTLEKLEIIENNDYIIDLFKKLNII